MKTLGDEVFIQRGEDWSLDVDVRNAKGDPYMIFSKWRNPYMVITVTAARYKQKGDYRHAWWLDLSKRMVQQAGGGLILVPQKTFIATEALYLPDFSITAVQSTYSSININDKTVDNYISNYLFFTDYNQTGDRIYKYYEGQYLQDVPAYETNATGEFVDAEGKALTYTWDEFYNTYMFTGTPVPIANKTVTIEASQYNVAFYQQFVYTPTDTTDNINNHLGEVWQEYNFRVVKAFDTKQWVEQTYLYDIKILSGESVEENVDEILLVQGFPMPIVDDEDDQLTPEEYLATLPLQDKLNMIIDDDTRLSLQELVDNDIPLMPNYETKAIVMLPKKLNVSANIQEGL